MARYSPAHLAPPERRSPPAVSRLDPTGGRHQPQHSLQAGQIRRRRLVRWAVGLVVVAGLSVTVGGAVSQARRPPSANTGAETEPSITTPVAVVSGQSGGGSPVFAGTDRENALPGSDGWKLTNRADNHEIEGYADATSVDHGQSVTLYVSTAAPTFHVDAYRMGYYQGLGARLIQTSSEIAGVRQAAAVFTPGINMVEAHWAPSLTLSTATWPPGEYLLKLSASTGKQRYVPLTLRNDASTAAFVVVNAVTTWQAYNLWGGYDLYEGRMKGGSDFTHRSRTVSFDRPYTLGDGAGDFLGLEYPLVSLVESLGLDVTYVTDVDLQHTPNPLIAHKAAISLGHDEYYSQVMRDALTDARDRGVNLAFLGANAIFRHIRFAPSPLGVDRREIDYKSAREDPLFGKNNADVTVDWRDPPNNNPESQIIGNFYQCNPVRADMVVADPGNWLFAGTGATQGQRLPDVVGSEYDRYDPSVPGPANVEILTHSPLRCHGKPDFADATYYNAASGAGVFAAGTIDWVGHIDSRCQPVNCAGRVLGKVMTNLLTAFGAGPAGLVHPSDPSQSSVRSRPPVSTTQPDAGSAFGPPAGGEQD